MPFDATQRTGACTVCGSPANILQTAFRVGEVVNCSRCGDFEVSHTVADGIGLPFRTPKDRALASYTIRKMQGPDAPRPRLTSEFFHTLRKGNLPTPAESSDNLILWLANEADGRPGMRLELSYADPKVLSKLGVVAESDVSWIVRNLTEQGMIALARGVAGQFNWTGHLTAKGWERFEDLRRAHVSSRFAFFARQFNNPELDTLFDTCLRPAVEQTGYEIRTVTQRADLIDAVIEDEIRRCRFLVADLSDANNGAYWEAGFAHGLGKPVIYICRANVATHFDANHRQTVKWNLDAPEDFATRLKAVIRNTLLGDATQSD